MGGIRIALPKPEDLAKIAAILKRFGIKTDIICNNASEVLTFTGRSESGILIVGTRLSDMNNYELCELVNTIDIIRSVRERYPRQRPVFKKKRLLPKGS